MNYVLAAMAQIMKIGIFMIIRELMERNQVLVV